MKVVQEESPFAANRSQHDRDFTALFEKNYARLVYFAYQIIGNKQESEDIVQNAFITYWYSRTTITPEQRSIKSYLYTTVRHSCFDVLKHRDVMSKHQNQLEADPTEETTIENEIIRTEVLAALFHSIEQLPTGCKQILEMSFLEGKKNQEIADELHLSINTVKTQKQRAIQLLKAKITDKSFELLLLFLLGEQVS